MTINRKNQARELVRTTLASRSIEATRHAVESLAETLCCSDPEFVGDSDTLLAGLLLSGNYTIDVLESAGANSHTLRKAALARAVGPGSWRPERHWAANPIESMFSNGSAGAALLAECANSSRPLRAEDILRSAIEPTSLENFGVPDFPLHLRRDTAPTQPLLQELERRVIEIIASCCWHANGSEARSSLSRRRTPLSTSEVGFVAEGLADDGQEIPPGHEETEEFRFVVRAANQWLVDRAILTTPTNICLRAMKQYSLLRFGTELFCSSGGDLGAVETNLTLAQRLAPYRDLPTLALFLENDRVHAGHFTHRNSFVTDARRGQGEGDLVGVNLQAIRPVPLLDARTLEQFEALLSENVSEAALQSFMVKHPELLTSLGYATARPHLCLYEPSGDKLVPDFILELPGAAGFDILDLKLPQAPLSVRKPFLRASYELTKALAQLHTYRRYFENAGNRREFHRRYGLQAFSPRLIVVMGRSSEIVNRDERVAFGEMLPGLRLVTYDELLAYGRTRSIDLPTSFQPDEPWG